jgi:hypothetical protein
MKYGFIREFKGSDSIIGQAKKLEDYGVKCMLPELEDDDYFDTILNQLNEGDELVITSINVLNDSVFDRFNEVARIADRKITLIILNQ